MHPPKKNRIVPLLLMVSAIVISGCAGLPVLDKKYKQEVATRQPTPKTETKPATQKPYRINGRTYYPLPSASGYSEAGIASWYGLKFHGRKTSNGEIYDMHDLTAAHKTLPMNTLLLVKNQGNGKELVVRVNDRGPFVKGRIIDLSMRGAQRLGMMEKGTARVNLTVLGETITTPGEGRAAIEPKFLTPQDFDAGEFFVQIGSFSNPANAERLTKKILDWEREAVIQPFDSTNGRFYRVQVRAGSSLKEARRLERVFAEAGFPDAFVVAR